MFYLHGAVQNITYLYNRGYLVVLWWNLCLTLEEGIILVINQLHKFLFYIKFIICFYMFRALLCSSSGGQNCIVQHLVSSHSAGGRPVHRLGEDSPRCQRTKMQPSDIESSLNLCTERSLTGAMIPDAV